MGIVRYCKYHGAGSSVHPTSPDWWLSLPGGLVADHWNKTTLGGIWTGTGHGIGSSSCRIVPSRIGEEDHPFGNDS